MEFQFNDGGREQAGYKGKSGDCVVRAIAIVTEKPYQEVYDEINLQKDSMKQTKRIRGSNSRNGVKPRVYQEYLKKLGYKWIPTILIGQGCKVHLKDGELPMGRFIVRLSKHLTSVIDGVIHDTFDCSRDGTRCVYGYWIKSGGH